MASNKANSKVEVPERPIPEEGSCHYYVERKRRLCRFKAYPGIQYCAEHSSMSGAVTARKRINCPYDAKHTCFANRLQHHMKKCPSKPKEMPPYHVLGINSGDDGGETVPNPKVTLLSVTPEEVQAMIDKVNCLYEEHVGSLEEAVLTHDCLKGELDNTSYGPAAMRHRKQQASLIGHMERLGLLADGMCYVEMGAGKGHLSHWLHAAVSDKRDIGFLLVDRSHVRNKVDNLHKEEGAGHVMDRIRMDIEHLRLGKVPTIEQSNRPIVAYGKHLCGAATDLALRCVMETLSGDVAEATDGDMTEPQRKRLKSGQRTTAGAVIALCCHHRCTWQPYVGKTFFRSCGLTARDFQLLSSMTSWATCAWKGWSHSRKEGQRSKVTADQGQGQEETNFVNKEVLVSTTDESSTPIKSDIPDNVLDTANEGTAKSLDERSTEGQRSTEDERSSGDAHLATESDIIDEDEHDVAEELTNTGINNKYSEMEREEIGRKCKRLIDQGRVAYLCDHGLQSRLHIYIEEYYTPENVVLVATS